MRRSPALLILALLGAAASAIASTDSPAQFATAEQGRSELSRRDDFVTRLSAFDRAARLKKAAAVSEDEYLAFVRSNVVDWSAEETRRVAAALDTVAERFRRSSLAFPSGVMLIRTTGNEEGDAAYTRGNAIVLPAARLRDGGPDLAQLLSHELFHIISRRDARQRDELYRSIGFEPCPEFEFPADLAPRRITNPDAPRNDHRIKLAYRGKPVWAIPILYADSGTYDPKRGGEFFDYLTFRFALAEAGTDVASAAASNATRLVETKDVQGFLEHVGRNTQYLIHPEEILADNFAIALSGDAKVPSPAIPREILRILHGAPPTGNGAAAAAWGGSNPQPVR